MLHWLDLKVITTMLVTCDYEHFLLAKMKDVWLDSPRGFQCLSAMELQSQPSLFIGGRGAGSVYFKDSQVQWASS